jgi:4-hydroxy-3-polyprenylbenzoate decarboxylase
MPYRTLAEFLEDLGRAGELAPVDAEVDPRLEVAEVARRVAWKSGPAILFRNVRGHDIPLLTNLLATEARVCRALGTTSIDEAAGRVDRMLNAAGGEGWLERLRFGSKSGAAGNGSANRVKSGACQQIVQIGSDVNLLDLPLVQTGTEVQTPALPSATILSAEPDSHAQRFLRGDLQLAGRDRLVATWTDVADPKHLLRQYRQRAGRMPIAVLIGGDPAVQLAAAAPMPSTADPLGLAGLLREKPLDAVACRSIDLLVPAESDIVIEGYIDPAEPAARGEPRYSPTGRVLGSQPGLTIHVTAVTHRANRVFSAVIPGVDCNECCVRDRTIARVFLPLLKLRIPELVDFDLPLSGGARHLAVLAIRKTYAGQARHVATVAWGMRPLDFARLLVVVDEEVDVRDAEQVFEAIVHEAHAVDDLWELAGPRDPIDPTASSGELSRRMAIDATQSSASEDQETQEGDIAQLVSQRWAQYGLGPAQDT